MDTCLIFTFHSPLQLSDYSFFDIGKKKPYFDEKHTHQRFKSNYKSIFKPALSGILDLLTRRDFRCSLYMSGTFLTALHRSEPATIEKLKKLIQDGKITIMGGTSHESIASLFSKSLFQYQLIAHKKLIEQFFEVSPTILNNTENIHYNDLLTTVEECGYKALLTESLTWYLHGNSPYQVFKSPKHNVSILLNQPSLPDNAAKGSGIITRHIDPLLATYDNWKQHIVNIMNQSEQLITAEEALKKYKPSSTYSIPMPIGRKRPQVGISSFTENAMQKEVITKLLLMEEKIKKALNTNLLYELSKFTSADYFLDMNYKTITATEKQPYDYYISMMNMLSDFEIKKMNL
ncbi:hypothetical protein LVD15_20440 [Fulvivirga maritima]|uniref:hypothetical protein n=1 Tax=Fulvivirga maritima TaxID=2904247 RepID=UPI001F2F7E40|nr:hypothetical protein [Fulvivirga maritima]UII25652.1 hypothetical protein LVD15_20440 [Fulvivirga maritima]